MALTSWIPIISAAAVAAVTAVVISVDGRSKPVSAATKVSSPSAAPSASAGPSAEYKAMEVELSEAKGHSTVYEASPNGTTFAPIQQNYNEAERLIKRLTDNDEKIKAGDVMRQIKALRDKASASEEARKRNRAPRPTGPRPTGPRPAGPAGPVGPTGPRPVGVAGPRPPPVAPAPAPAPAPTP